MAIQSQGFKQGVYDLQYLMNIHYKITQLTGNT